MIGFEAEIAAPVLVVDARRRIDDPRPEAHVVRLDEAHGVPIGVDRGEEDRATAARIGRGRRRAGTDELDPGREGRQPVAVEEHLDRHVPRRGVGHIRITVGHGDLGRLQVEVDPAGIRDALRPERPHRRRLEPLE